MNQIQILFLILFGLISLITTIVSYFNIASKNNPFGLTPKFLNLFTIFVWGDGLPIGLFLTLTTLISLYLNHWNLFLLFMSTFFLVRSVGETIYWLNEQFSSLKRNPPETLTGFKIYKNDSIWFAYQIFWQCLSAIFFVLSLYLLKKI